MILAKLFQKVDEMIAAPASCTFRYEESLLAWETLYSYFKSCKNFNKLYYLTDRIVTLLDEWLEKSIRGVYGDVVTKMISTILSNLYVTYYYLDRILLNKDPAVMARCEEDVLKLLVTSLTEDVVLTFQVISFSFLSLISFA